MGLYNRLQQIIGDENKTAQVMELFYQQEKKWQEEYNQMVQELTAPPRRGRPIKPLPEQFGEIYQKYRNHTLTRIQAMEELHVSSDQFYRMVRKYKSKEK